MESLTSRNPIKYVSDPLLSKHCLCGVECQFETVVIMLLSTSPNLRKVNHRKQGKTATDLSQFYPVGTETLMDNNGSKYAHFHTFCCKFKIEVQFSGRGKDKI